MTEHLFVCGLSSAQRARYKGGRELHLTGSSANLVLKVEDIRRRLLSVEPHLVTDLLELAVYIFAADCLVKRGSSTLKGMGMAWRRSFHLVVAVREPGQWAKNERLSALQSALHFLSEDDWVFEFVDLESPPGIQAYLRLKDREAERAGETSIVLFSGGIDSFAGAVHELTQSNRHVLLMSRRIQGMIDSRQTELAGRLRERYPQKVSHAGIRAGLTLETAAREHTQRTRSFLLAAIAMAAAEMEQSDRVRFYENGIMSVNLPISAQVVGARASRSTHPRSLMLLQELGRHVLSRQVAIDNPFVWMTKVEVIRDLQQTPFGAFTHRTLSCSRTREMIKRTPHCGLCAQCIHRRISTLGAGASMADSEEGYAVDLVLGPRQKNEDRAMAVDTVRSALEFVRTSDAEFATRYAGELAWLTTAFPGTAPEEVARESIAMFRRHGAVVGAIFTQATEEHAKKLVHRQISDDCLLRIVLNAPGMKLDGAEIVTPMLPLASSERAEPAERSEIHLALDDAQQLILIDGIARIKGATNFRLVAALVQRFKEDRNSDVAPKRFQTLSTHALADEISANEDLVRKAISRLRKYIRQEFRALHDEELGLDDVIENVDRKGYRINPKHVRVVSSAEILGR